MASKQILDSLEAWAKEQAAEQHQKFLGEMFPRCGEYDNPAQAAYHSGQATAYEDTLEKIAELKGHAWL